MKLVKQLFSAIYRIYCTLLFFIELILLYPLFYLLLSNKKYFPIAFKLKRLWSKVLQITFLFPIRVKGKEKLPPSPFIICSNHTSYVDIIHMYAVIPKCFVFMAKHELLRIGLFRIFFKTSDIAVNRESNIQAARSLIKAKQAIDNNLNIVIFPEGTIPPVPPKLGPFKNGAFQLAIEKQVPIVPVTFVNTWRIFPCTENFWGPARPGIAEAIIHDFIPTKGLSEKDLVHLRNKVFDVIDQNISK